MEGFFVGVDVGTQSVKALVLEGSSGRVVGRGSRGVRMVEGLPRGHMEQRPQDWFQAAVEAVREAVGRSGVEPGEVRGLGVSGQQHGLVALGEGGRVVRPAKLWNDTSTWEECRMLHEALGGPEGLIALVGNPALPGYTAPKVLWLKRHEPTNYERTRAILLPHDYLNYRLTGVAAMEYGDASGTLLMDVRSREWCPEVVEAIDPDLWDRLPQLGPSHRPVGPLLPRVAKLMGLPSGVLVSAGGGDNMMGAIGTGNTRPGRVTASLGTSGTIYAYSPTPVVDPRGEVAAFCDSTNAWLPLVCTMNVTVATEAVRRLLGLSLEAFEEAVAAAPAGSEGLLMLPYLTGERTPNLPHGCGALYGVTQTNLTPSNLARASVEGATLGLNYGLNRLRALGVRPREIRLTGGASRNRAWAQICADVFQAPVVGFTEQEGAALGAAIQAMWCTALHVEGEKVSIQDLADSVVKLDEASRLEPGGDAEQYRLLQQHHDSLREKLFPRVNH